MDMSMNIISVMLLLWTVFEIKTIRADYSEKRGCYDHPADLVFLLDESSSIYGPDFQVQLGFVNDVISAFDVRAGQTHVGVETFSNNARVHFNMGDITSPEALRKAVSSITQRRGETGTALALQRMREEMFSPAYARTLSDVPRVAIVITDGESDDPSLTAIEAAEIHGLGIIVFAIGVGVVNDKQLYAIASSRDYMFKVANYIALNTLKGAIAAEACKATTPSTTPTTTTTKTTTEADITTTEADITTTEADRTTTGADITTTEADITTTGADITTTGADRTTTGADITTTVSLTNTTTQPQHRQGCRPADVIFSVPDEAGIRDTNTSLTFIQSLISDIDIGVGAVRVGLTPRICADRYPIPLNGYDTLSGYKNALNGRRLTSSRISQQVEQLQIGHENITPFRRDLTSSAAVKIAILIVDNTPEDPDLAMYMSQYAQSQGIRLVSVGIGDYIDKEQLVQMASNETDSYHVTSYDNLSDIYDELFDVICDSW